MKQKIFRRAWISGLGLLVLLAYVSTKLDIFNQIYPTPKNTFIESRDTSTSVSEKYLSKTDKSYDQKSKDSLQQDETIDYKEEMLRWINSGKDVALGSEVVEAEDVMFFLEETMRPARPHNYSFVPLDSTDSNIIGFVFVKTHDSLPKNNFWNSVVVDNSGINCIRSEGKTMLVVNAGPELSSPKMRGLVTIFQGSLAQYSFEHRYGPNNKAIEVEALLKAHHVKNRVMLEIGGEPYRECLEKEIRRLDSLIDSAQAHNPLEDFFPGQIDYGKELNGIFSANTKFEENKLAVYFHSHATFLLVERRYATDAARKKRLYIEALYFINQNQADYSGNPLFI